MDINFQSVFDNNVEEEKAFDTIFGSEEDDELLSVVLGEGAEDELDVDALISESDDSSDMNTLDDGSTVKDIEKDVVGEEIEAPKCEPSENVKTPDETDSEKDKPGEDIACPQAGVADAVQNKEPDEENIEEEIDKSENKVDLDEAFLDAILGEETEIDYDTAADASDEEQAPKDEKCNKEGEGCDGEECDNTDSEIAPDTEEIPATPSDDGEEEDLDAVFADDDDDDDDEEEAIEDNCKKENVEEIEDNQAPELDDNTEVNDDSQLDGEPGLPGEPGMDNEEVGLESSENLDDIFAESEDIGEEEDEVIEDQIISAAEDNSEMSDAEVDALIGDDEEDDLLAAVMGDE